MDGTNMNKMLPTAFVNRMRMQLGDELPAFLNAIEEVPVRGIRINSLKPNDAVFMYYSVADGIPWAQDAYYLPLESDAGATVLHASGAFYIQEPGAMIPAAVLDAKPGEYILDLCAAPGGKSTQIGCAMKGMGLLVCNEPVPKRAEILSGNIERMGLPNTVVTCELPGRLAEKWPEGFDAVLVDAPCSGEGMFRRDPDTRNEWSEEKAEGCAQRQREILKAAAGLVRKGGRLVYSTCTYNPEENERNASWFTETCKEFHREAFFLPGINAPDGMHTCYPHRLRGEGQFTALFRKSGNAEPFLPEDQSLPKPTGADIRTFSSAFPFFPEATHLFGKTLVSLPYLPDVKGIRTRRVGLHLGEVRGKTAVPDHAVSLCFHDFGTQTVDISAEEVKRYTAGETLSGGAEGWVIVRYRGMNTGWVKGSGGMIKNHYPKGLRSTHLVP